MLGEKQHDPHQDGIFWSLIQISSKSRAYEEDGIKIENKVIPMSIASHA